MKIVNGLYQIRSAVDEDVVLLNRWWNDGKVMAHAGFADGLHHSLERSLEDIHKNTSNRQRLMILYQDTPIGEMNFEIIDQLADIGIKICDFDYQNQGHGPIFLQMLIDYLFDERHLDKIVLDTNLENKRAQHVYEKLGFKQVSISYDSWTDQQGKLQSGVNYELTKKRSK